MTKRRKINGRAQKNLFRKTANRTNSKNIAGARTMMRGGFHF